MEKIKGIEKIHISSGTRIMVVETETGIKRVHAVVKTPMLQVIIAPISKDNKKDWAIRGVRHNKNGFEPFRTEVRDFGIKTIRDIREIQKIAHTIGVFKEVGN